MADAVSLEGLQFEISAATSEAIKNIDTLSQSFKNLKSAVDTNINGAIEKFGELGKAISAVSENNPIHKLAESLEKIAGMSKLSNIKIPELKISDNFSENITKISSAVESLDTDKLGTFYEKIRVFEGISGAATSLNDFGQAISSFPAGTLSEKATKIVNILQTNAGGTFVSKFSELSKITSSFPIQTLSSVAIALGQIRDNYSISIPKSFIDEFKLLTDTADKVTDNALAKISGVAFYLKSFNEVSSVKFPRGLNTALSNFVSVIKAIKEPELEMIKKFSEALKGLSGLKDIKLSSSIANQISKISDALKKLTEDDIKKLYWIADATKKIGEVGDKSLKLKINTSDVEKAKKATSGLKYSLNDAFKDVGRGFKDIGLGIFKTISSIPKGIKQAFSGNIASGLKNIFISPLQGIFQVASGIFRIASSARALTPILTKAFTAPLKYAGKLSVAIGKSLLSPIQKVASRLKVVIAGFGKIIKLRAFRFIITSITGGIKEGTDNLYQFSKGINGEFAKSMDTLATSMLYFKNSVGAVLAPIINQLAPAIDILVDKIVDVTNKINQFLAQMAGATYWTKAVKYPKEYAEAVNDAKKSVQDFTMGFDELNIISDNNSGKSADALDYSKMFEIVDLQKNPWTEQLKEAIENGDWYGAGNLLGEKFNGIFQNIDYSESGAELGTKINNAISLAKGFLDVSDFETVGTGIASFLNSGFEQIDFYNLGSVLAGKWNILIDTVHGFVTEFKFAKFGEELSNTVNGWFDTIDLNKAVNDLSIGLRGILDLISSFLKNTNFSEFGSKVGGALNKFIYDLPSIVGRFAGAASDFTTGVFDFLSSTIEGIDWFNSGTKLFDAIKNLFTKVDWDKVAESFSEFIGSALSAAFGLLLGFIAEAESAYSKIFDWLSSGEVDVGKEALDWSNEHVVKPLLKGIVTNLEGEETWNDINDVIEEKGSMWDFWQGYGEYIYDQWHKAGKGAGEYSDSLYKIEEYTPIASEGWFKFWNNVGEEAFDNIDKAYNKWVKFWEDIGGKVFDTLPVIADKIKQGAKDIIEGFKSGLAWKGMKLYLKQKLVDPFINGFKIPELIDKIKQGAKDIIEGFKSGLAWTVMKQFLKEKLVDPFINGFKSLFGIHSPSTVMAEQGTFIIAGLKNGIAEALKGIDEWITEHIFKPFTDAFAEFQSNWAVGWKDINEKFSSFKSDISTGAEILKNNLSKSWDSIKSKVSDTLEPLFNTAKSNFGTFKSNWIDGAETIKNTLSEKWDSIKIKFSETINPMWDTAKSNFSSFKSDWLSGWEKIKTGLSNKWSEIKNDASNVFSPIETSFKNGANAIIGLIEGMVNNVIFAFNEMGRVLNSFSFDIPDWVPGIGGGSFSLNLPEWSEISLTRFDKGGFPNSGDLFFANENGRPEFVGSMGGRTAVANNDQIVEGIYSAVYSAFMQAMSSENGRNGTPEINVYLDSKQITAKVEERKLARGQQIFTGGVVNEY